MTANENVAETGMEASDLVTEFLSNVESMCRNFDILCAHGSTGISSNEQRIVSATIDSIEIDTLQQIQNTCESIEKNINHLLECTSIPSAQSSIAENNTVINQSPSSNLQNTRNNSSLSTSDECNLLTGNPSTMDKAIKEVFTHKQIPESLNRRQKRQMPSPSGVGPRIEQIIEATPSSLPAKTTDRRAENTGNDSNGEILKVLTLRLPLRLPQARLAHRLPDRDSISGEVDTPQSSGTHLIDPTLSVHQSHDRSAEQSSHLNETETLSKSMLVQELVNESSRESTNARQSQEHRNDFHLSNLSKTTTKAMVLDYMKLMGVHDTSQVKLSSLLPKNHDPSTLSFMSYKIDTNDEIAAIVQTRDFWPPNSKFRSFVHKRPSLAEFGTQDSNFQLHRQQTRTSRRAN